MLSKLDYEEKKKYYEEGKEETENKGGKVKKKKEKPMPMSLEEFNNMNLNQVNQCMNFFLFMDYLFIAELFQFLKYKD